MVGETRPTLDRKGCRFHRSRNNLNSEDRNDTILMIIIGRQGLLIPVISSPLSERVVVSLRVTSDNSELGLSHLGFGREKDGDDRDGHGIEPKGSSSGRVPGNV